jgi:hypothetical protein
MPHCEAGSNIMPQDEDGVRQTKINKDNAAAESGRLKQ